MQRDQSRRMQVLHMTRTYLAPCCLMSDDEDQDESDGGIEE